MKVQSIGWIIEVSSQISDGCKYLRHATQDPRKPDGAVIPRAWLLWKRPPSWSKPDDRIPPAKNRRSRPKSSRALTRLAHSLAILSTHYTHTMQMPWSSITILKRRYHCSEFSLSSLRWESRQGWFGLVLSICRSRRKALENCDDIWRRSALRGLYLSCVV